MSSVDEEITEVNRPSCDACAPRARAACPPYARRETLYTLWRSSRERTA